MSKIDPTVTHKPIRSPEYDRVIAILFPFLTNRKHSLIAITGAMLSGKTSLGRFLAWYFNCSLIESDQFIASGPPLTYYEDEVKRLIVNKQRGNRPAIIEGVDIWRLLQNIDCTPDFHIHLWNAGEPPERFKQQESPGISLGDRSVVIGLNHRSRL